MVLLHFDFAPSVFKMVAAPSFASRSSASAAAGSSLQLTPSNTVRLSTCSHLTDETAVTSLLPPNIFTLHTTTTATSLTTTPTHHAYCDDSMNDAQPGPSDYSDSNSTRNSDISSGKRPVEQHPQNLRFQRRTSERAYYEGSYREGPPTPRMDYSAVNPSSPWASSPEASRQSFGDGNVSREDLPPPAVSNTNAGENIERPGSGWEQDQPKQWQPQTEAQAHRQQQDYQSDGQRHGEPEDRRPQSAARYHGAAPHPAQQRQPQYKLQTKITGLERTGKKDAILRFDVYVCHARYNQFNCHTLTST